MKFIQLLRSAKNGDQEAVMMLEEMFLPLMLNYSTMYGKFDYELFCCQQLKLIECIKSYKL